MRLAVLASSAVLVVCTLAVNAQDTSSGYRGRKYKAPPATSHIEVTVLRGNNGKPLENAAVIFHSLLDGKDEGNLEVKTNGEGKAVIDIIPTHSSVDVQVIKDGFATYANTYQVDEDSRSIEIRLVKPRAQVSTYEDNTGKASDRQPGVQEPAHPSSTPVVEPPQPTNHTSDPNPITPVSPNATPGNSQNPTPKPQ